MLSGCCPAAGWELPNGLFQFDYKFALQKRVNITYFSFDLDEKLKKLLDFLLK